MKNHRAEAELKNLKKENSFASLIINKIDTINAINEQYMDNMWERDIMKYKAINEIVNEILHGAANKRNTNPTR